MDLKDINEKLVAVQTTLDTIKIDGIQNMSKIVGCAQVIQDVLNEIKKAENSKPAK